MICCDSNPLINHVQAQPLHFEDPNNLELKLKQCQGKCFEFNNVKVDCCFVIHSMPQYSKCYITLNVVSYSMLHYVALHAHCNIMLNIALYCCSNALQLADIVSQQNKQNGTSDKQTDSNEGGTDSETDDESTQAEESCSKGLLQWQR